MVAMNLEPRNVDQLQDALLPIKTGMYEISCVKLCRVVVAAYGDKCAVQMNLYKVFHQPRLCLKGLTVALN